MRADAIASDRLDGSAAITQRSCGSSAAAAHSAHRPDGDPWSPRFRRLVEACEALGAAEDLAVLERAIETFGVDRLGRARLELPVAPSPRARLLLRELCDVVLARHGELVVRWAEGPTRGVPEVREYNPLCSLEDSAADGRPLRVVRLAPNREERKPFRSPLERAADGLTGIAVRP